MAVKESNTEIMLEKLLKRIRSVTDLIDPQNPHRAFADSICDFCNEETKTVARGEKLGDIVWGWDVCEKTECQANYANHKLHYMIPLDEISWIRATLSIKSKTVPDVKPTRFACRHHYQGDFYTVVRDRENQMMICKLSALI
jgi:hypothetical protein